jgi:hypothetical protein
VTRKYFPPVPKLESKKVDKADAAEKVEATKTDKKTKAGEQTKSDKQPTDTDDDKALTDDEWVKIDDSEIPKKASVEDVEDE